jgi:hypothetical protein
MPSPGLPVLTLSCLGGQGPAQTNTGHSGPATQCPLRLELAIRTNELNRVVEMRVESRRTGQGGPDRHHTGPLGPGAQETGHFRPAIMIVTIQTAIGVNRF